MAVISNIEDIDPDTLQEYATTLEKNKLLSATEAQRLRRIARDIRTERAKESKIYKVAEKIFTELNKSNSITVVHSQYSSGYRVCEFCELGEKEQQPFKDAAKVAIQTTNSVGIEL